jgi:hypothetical protein
MSDANARLAALEEQLSSLQQRVRWQRRAAFAVLVCAGVLVAVPVDAGGGKKIRLSDPATGQEAYLTASGITFSTDGQKDAMLTRTGVSFFEGGKQRLSLDISPEWTGMSVFGDNGAVGISAGVEHRYGSSIKVFSTEQKQLRLELAEKLLDAGSGVRLYDHGGFPRATLYADRRGEAGVEFTDADRQPRIDIYAKPDGQSVIRANDSEAEVMVELSVLPESDAVVRKTGVYVEHEGDEPLVPMLYMNDASGEHLIQMLDEGE